MSTYAPPPAPSTAAAAAPVTARAFTSPATVPAHALAYGRRVVRGLRFPTGAVLVRELIRVCAQARGRRLDRVELERAVLLGRALWHEGTPSPLGGRAF